MANQALVIALILIPLLYVCTSTKCDGPLNTLQAKTMRHGICLDDFITSSKDPLSLLAGALQRYTNTDYSSTYHSKTHFYLHEADLPKFSTFVTDMQNDGTEFEKKYYADKTGNDIIRKCIDNRAITFDSTNDRTILRDLIKTVALYLPWDVIGTDMWEQNVTRKDKHDILLAHLVWVQKFQEVSMGPNNIVEGWKMKDAFISIDTPEQYDVSSKFNILHYLSYKEMQLCALLAVAGPSQFYNNGDRCNRGQKKVTEEGNGAAFKCKCVNSGGQYGVCPVGTYWRDDRRTQGYVMGAVGARMERVNYLSYETVAKVHESWGNASAMGLEISSEPPPAYLEYIELNRGMTFGYVMEGSVVISNDVKGLKDNKAVQWESANKEYLRHRYKNAYETYFLYVYKTIKEITRGQAFVRVTGLGAGVWTLNEPEQKKMILEVIFEILNEKNTFAYNTYIYAVDFPFFDKTDVFNEFKSTIKIIYSNNAQFSDKGMEGCRACHLFNLYAWDSNSAPGNEFWVYFVDNNKFDMDDGGKRGAVLEASGDPATASASDIIFTQTPWINTELGKKVLKLNRDGTTSEISLEQRRRLTTMELETELDVSMVNWISPSLGVIMFVFTLFSAVFVSWFFLQYFY